MAQGQITRRSGAMKAWQKYEQLENYIMLYNHGDECIDVTGGWNVVNVDLRYTPTSMQIQRNNDNIYTTQSGSGVSGPMTKNRINISGYKGVGFVGCYKANNASWETFGIMLTDNLSDIYRQAFGLIGTNSANTTKKMYTKGIAELTDWNTVANLVNAYCGANVSYNGNITMYSYFIYKEDDWSTLASKGGVSASSISNLLTKSSTILSNEEAVDFMIYQCTGEFMIAAIQNSTFKTALASSAYKELVYANEHWAKFLAMVA